MVPALGRVVASIPRPIANALLAGVLLKLCFAPALALGSIPLLVLPIMVAWLAGLLWHRLAAMPLAVIAFVGVMVFAVDFGAFSESLGQSILPPLTPIQPTFSIQSLISIAVTGAAWARYL